MEITIVQKTIVGNIVQRSIIATISNLRGIQGPPGNSTIFFDGGTPAGLNTSAYQQSSFNGGFPFNLI